MLSKVALISTGRTLFFGKRRDLLSYFSYIDYPCPAYKNPSDYYLDLVTLDNLSSEAMLESSQRIESLVQVYQTRSADRSGGGRCYPAPWSGVRAPRATEKGRIHDAIPVLMDASADIHLPVQRDQHVPDHIHLPANQHPDRNHLLARACGTGTGTPMGPDRILPRAPGHHSRSHLFNHPLRMWVN